MEYIQYPVAKTWRDAKKCLESGGELWVEWIELPEDAEDGECYQIEDIADLDYMRECEPWSTEPSNAIHLVID